MSATVDPQASQPLRALAVANRIRLGQAQVKREVAAGELSVQAALDDERAARMRVGDVLKALPRWGDERVRRLFEAVGVGELTRVRDLTLRQYCAIVDRFEPAPVVVEPPAAVPVLARPSVPGMEPERVDARVLRALMLGPATRVELALRLQEMRLPVDDLDAALARLRVRLAVRVIEGDGYVLFSAGPRSGRAAA